MAFEPRGVLDYVLSNDEIAAHASTLVASTFFFGVKFQLIVSLE